MWFSHTLKRKASYNFIFQKLFRMKIPKLILLSIMLFPLFSYSQYSIFGKIIDTEGRPIEFGNVVCLDAVTGEFIKGTITDSLGKFQIELREEKIYELQISYLGYKSVSKKINLEHKLNLGELRISRDTQSLNEVIITSRKETITREGEKIIMRVQGNPFLKGKDALGILRVAPGVWVDNNSGAISLKGIETTIFINGKNPNMNQQALNSFLNSLSDEQIISIEIISNPSAKYEAEGLGGIVNIVLQEQMKQGFSGGISSRTSIGRFFSSNNSFQLNSQLSEKISFDAFLVYKKNKNLNFENRTETIKNPFTQYSYRKIDTISGIGKFLTFDFSYAISDRDKLLFQYRILDNDSDRLKNIDLTIKNEDISFSDGTYWFQRKSGYQSYGFNFEHLFDSFGQKIDFIADYYDSEVSSRNQYQNIFYNSENEIIDENRKRSVSPAFYSIFSTQLDYTKPIGNHKLEAGLKVSSVNNANEAKFENFIDGEYIVDENFSNVFEYDEQIYGIYVTYAIDTLFSPTFDLEIGLRGEYTSGNGRIPDTEFSFKKKYFNIFPSLFLTKELPKNKYLVLSYSRRINRPNYQRFNPTIFYITDFTSQVGNPELDPSYTNAFELNYNSSDINAMVYFNDINGEAREILKQLIDSKLRYQWRNIDQTSVYGMSFSANRKVVDWLRLNLNTSLFGKDYKSTFNDVIENIETSKITFRGRFSIQMELPYEVISEMSFQYNGPEIYGQFEAGENHAFYFNFSKKITNKLFMSVNISDPFNQLRYTFKNNQKAFQTYQFRNNYRRKIDFLVRYNFDLGRETKDIELQESNRTLRNRSN